MESDLPHFLQFWGKARPAPGSGQRWHPVAFHLLDVAAVAQVFLDVRPVARTRACRLLETEEPNAAAILVALAGIHDLGKFARCFQAKCPELWPEILGPFDAATIPTSPHTRDGFLLWDEYLRGREDEREWIGDPRVRPLMQAAFGHHGRPVENSLHTARSVFGDAGLAAAEACAEAVLSVVARGHVIPAPAEARGERASWWVAGFISIADWVGSNQDWFPYESPSGLEAYWEKVQRRARTAVERAGLVPPAAARGISFADLIPHQEPTPAQRWAETVRLPEGPVLVLLEDATGAGKTEAAQMLVHRLVASGRASGAYWAMPTQATANAMFGRQGKTIAKMFEGGVRPSLALAHSQARFHDGFQSAVIRAGREEEAYGEDDADVTASAACAAFLADDRRASLVADIGVGTVDQAFLAVLPSKFNTVRLAGLAEKVLILDEAHAYDPYMRREALALLRFQAALGGHAVILSATLPLDLREDLARAWREASGPRLRLEGGLFGLAPRALLGRDAYPLGTVVSAGVPIEAPIPAAAQSYRDVAVRFVHDVRSAAEVVVEAQARGAAVAWVRNTVDDCLKAAALLRDRGLDPIVFHARFAQGDRQIREAGVLCRFGPESGADDRRGRVLVATQVIEQSLDLDFDLMVTDLAPMDLLIQRAGRLWRHPSRNPERAPGCVCELVVLTPPAVDEPGSQWLAGEFRGTAKVYPNPGVLWLTARLLSREGAIRSPGGIRMLVEDAYSTGDLPPGLQDRADRADAEAGADSAAAQYAVLSLDDGYNGCLRMWENDARVLTRLGEARTTVRLASVGQNGALQPWFEADDGARAWALSEVKVSAWRLPFDSRPHSNFARAVAAVRQNWSRFEQDVPILPLRPGPNGLWTGELVKPDGGLVSVVYSSRDGLTYGQASGDD